MKVRKYQFLIVFILCQLKIYNCEYENSNESGGLEVYIAGGEEAKNHPFHVGLIRNGEKSVFCSGTLISEDTVLTAAHCFNKTDIDDVTVVVGAHDLNLKEELEYFTLKEIIPHEKYNPSKFEYDFCILKLDKPVKLGPTVRTIRLPDDNSDVNALVGKNGTVFGWGLNENYTSVFILRQLKLEILSNSVCQNIFNLAKTNISVTANQICGLSSIRNSTTCQGDSGGGLIYKQEDGKTFIIGVLSAGKKRCHSSIPTLFASVVPNLGWIKSHLYEIDRAPTTASNTIKTAATTTTTAATTTTVTTTKRKLTSTTKPGDCQRVFLFSSGKLGEAQSALLGTYNLKGKHNGRPFYTKLYNNQENYLFFQSDKHGGHAGWIVGSKLDGSTFNIVVRKSETNTWRNDQSPVGIQGGYDRDFNESFDETFKIECDDPDEKLEQNCCPEVTVMATGSISVNQSAHLGTYTKVGVFNGHALYSMKHRHDNQTSYLHFRKKGVNLDGWTISNNPENDAYSITTRERPICPDEVTQGFDRNTSLDKGFQIICTVNKESDY